jgi:hypothetical protein
VFQQQQQAAHKAAAERASADNRRACQPGVNAPFAHLAGPSKRAHLS